MPFHQTAQWLTYSLVEPLVWSGFEIVDLNGLTALMIYGLSAVPVSLILSHTLVWVQSSSPTGSMDRYQVAYKISTIFVRLRPGSNLSNIEGHVNKSSGVTL